MRTINRALVFGGLVLGLLALGGSVYAAAVIAAPSKITYAAQTGNFMQDFTSAMCAEMDTYTTQLLTDARDGHEYRARKMPDGRCWMIDNLMLKDYTLTSADSDVSESFTIPANPVQSTATHGNGVCVGGTAASTGNYLTCDGTSTQSTTNTPFIAYSDPSGIENNYYDSCLHRNGISEDSTTGCGYFYNWYTATAGTGVYDAATNSNAASSICPAGWRLPTSGFDGQFPSLNAAMANGSAATSVQSGAGYSPNWQYNGPFEGALAGYYDSYLVSSGYNGIYWSSTAMGVSSSVYSVGISYASHWSGAAGNYKYQGLSVRCVLR